MERWSTKRFSSQTTSSSFPWQQQQRRQQQQKDNNTNLIQEQDIPPDNCDDVHFTPQTNDDSNSTPTILHSNTRLQSIVDKLNSSSYSRNRISDDSISEVGGLTDLSYTKDASFDLGSHIMAAPWAHGAESTPITYLEEYSQNQVEEEERGHSLGMKGSKFNDDISSAHSQVKGQPPKKSPSNDLPLIDPVDNLMNHGDDQLDSEMNTQGSKLSEKSSQSKVSTVVDKFRDSMKGRSLHFGNRTPVGKPHPHHQPDTTHTDKAMDAVFFPWEREDATYKANGLHGKSNTELAEKTIPETELRRLRDAALRMKERMEVGAAGITQTVVESIHKKWKRDEVVKMRFEGPVSLNMKRTHEMLEAKTGGIVIWRSGRSLVLYRGMTYQLPCVQSYAKLASADFNQNNNIGADFPTNSAVQGQTEHHLLKSKGNVNCPRSFVNPSKGIENTPDLEGLLDQLGPRFKDWSGFNPIPVDADLLPGVVPGYMPPFRFLPYGTRNALRDGKMTSLRRLARRMTPHFALGRNRQHQGLANAIVKLWEKSAIAKIAIKRGVPNTCNERMAEEIRKLTGGVLLSRNKEYIVFYRGKDFVKPSIRDVLVNQQHQATMQHDEEEAARLRASASITYSFKASNRPLVAGTLAETVEATSRWGSPLNAEEREKVKKDVVFAKHASLVRNLERKLSLAKAKVAKAERALAKVQKLLIPAELPTDLEAVTDEERALFRKMGLKMRAFLLLGRRGFFDGTVENMHLHWKHRELVKIIVKGKSFAQVKHIAISLEAESGGVLISLDKTTKGYAIVFYRGKNYERPRILKPRNLLTKKQALARSIELQRREALNHHIFNLEDNIQMLKSQLEQMKTGKELHSSDLFSRANDALLSDEDDDDDDGFEDEGEEAYLETYSSGDEEDADASSNDYL